MSPSVALDQVSEIRVYDDLKHASDLKRVPHVSRFSRRGSPAIYHRVTVLHVTAVQFRLAWFELTIWTL